MTTTEPAVPRRCTCPHFENEHETPAEHGQPTPCRAKDCACPDFTPRPVPERHQRPTTQPRRHAEPQQIEATVLGIRDRARQQGRLLTTTEQQELDEVRHVTERQREREADRQRWLARTASVPTRFRQQPPDWQPHPDVDAWCQHVVAGGTDSLVLLGGVGTGKTTQGYAAWCSLVSRGVGRPEWVTVPDLLDGLRPGRPAQLDLQDLQTASLLLLDDLAAERGSEWTVEVLYRLLDYRYAWALPTIITSNVPPPEITARLGDRIASRLAGMGRTVVLDGPDHRRPGRA